MGACGRVWGQVTGAGGMWQRLGAYGRERGEDMWQGYGGMWQGVLACGSR